MEINVGDTVELKSGGPIMTVNKLIPAPGKRLDGAESAQVECIWFDAEHKMPIRHEFVETTLVLFSLEESQRLL